MNHPIKVPFNSKAGAAVPPDGAFNGPTTVTTAVKGFTLTKLSGAVGESSLVAPQSWLPESRAKLRMPNGLLAASCSGPTRALAPFTGLIR